MLPHGPKRLIVPVLGTPSIELSSDRLRVGGDTEGRCRPRKVLVELRTEVGDNARITVADRLSTAAGERPERDRQVFR